MIINETTNKKDKIRWGLTLALGMLVVLWRVFLPTNVEITTGLVILVAVLDMVLTASLVFINRQELKEAFQKKFGIKGFLKFVLCCVLYLVYVNIQGIVIHFAEIELAPSPASWVAEEFHRIFPLGLFISTAIAAPIWEEIAFRMAGQNLIKNKILFVLITTLLFVFIHTGFALSTGLFYALSGIGFAVIYLATKDIRIVIGVHFMWNLTMNLLSFFMQT